MTEVKLVNVTQGIEELEKYSKDAVKILEEKYGITVSQHQALPTLIIGFMEAVLKNDDDSIEFRREQDSDLDGSNPEDTISAVFMSKEIREQLIKKEPTMLDPIVFDLLGNQPKAEEEVSNLGAVGEITEAISNAKEQE